MEQRIWLQRKFSFDLPLSLYPNIIERLRGTPARIEDLVRGLAGTTTSHRDGSKWSIQEHIGHLIDLEPLGFIRLADYRAGKEVLTAADVENRKTEEANHNGTPLDELLKNLRHERMEFVAQLEAFDESIITRSALHPRLQIPMRVIDYCYFVAEHDDHHVASISQLIKTFRTR